MPRIPHEQMPIAALERVALGGALATNRWLQPEMLGRSALLELQAGPRYRLIRPQSAARTPPPSHIEARPCSAHPQNIC